MAAPNRPFPRQIEAKVALVRREMTPSEAAARLGYARSYFTAALNGLVPMTKPLAERLGELLDLDPGSLLSRDEVKTS